MPRRDSSRCKRHIAAGPTTTSKSIAATASASSATPSSPPVPSTTAQHQDEPEHSGAILRPRPAVDGPGHAQPRGSDPEPAAPVSVTGSNQTLVLTLPPNYFPPGDYQLKATCVTDDTPPFAAAPLTYPNSQLPNNLSATPQGGLLLQLSCVNPQKNGIHVAAYPNASGPNGPDAQTFNAPTGQTTFQATYSRQGDYNIEVDCSNDVGQTVNAIVLDSAFPRLLTIRKSGQVHLWLYCDRDQQLTSPMTLSLAAQIPNPPTPLQATDSSSPVILRSGRITSRPVTTS